MVRFAGGRTERSGAGGVGQQTGHGGLHERGGGPSGARLGGAEEPNVPGMSDFV